MTTGCRTIVVPLDGSSFAERALSCAAEMARAHGARLLLLRVVHGESMLSLRHGAEDATTEDEATGYLAAVAAQLQRDCRTACETLVVGGDPAATIVHTAEARHAGLVVMATHGRTGPSRWIMGSVAHRVLQEAKLPVLLVPPTPEAAPATTSLGLRTAAHLPAPVPAPAALHV